MKLGTVESLKFKKLKMKLGLAQWQAIGLLESLWMFTARNAPLGDIGRHSNEDIAVHLEWSGDADSLILALTECRWIDESEEHRLLIHDWADHLPMWLQGNLKRHDKKPIVAKQAAKQATKQPAKQTAKDATKAGCSGDVTIFSSDLISSELTKECVFSTDEKRTDGDKLTFPTGPSADAIRFFEAYPKKTKKNLVADAFLRAVDAVAASRGWSDGPAAEWLIAKAQVFAKSPMGSQPDRDKIPNPAAWLDEGRYDDGPGEWNVKPAGDRKPTIKPLPKDARSPNQVIGDALMEAMK